MIGTKIGKGTVIAEAKRPEHIKSKHKFWKVECECRTICLVPSSSIRGNKWKSCGCLHEPNLIGKQFHDGKVIQLLEPDGKGNRVWLLECKCGKQYKAITNSLTQNNTKGCGCRNYREGNKHPNFKGVGDLTGEYWGKLKKRC